MLPTTSINVLEPFLPWQVVKVCRETDLKTVADMAQYTEACWLRTPKIGPKSFDAVRQLVEAAGLHFRGEDKRPLQSLETPNYDRAIKRIEQDYKSEMERLESMRGAVSDRQLHMWMLSAKYDRRDSIRELTHPRRVW